MLSGGVAAFVNGVFAQPADVRSAGDYSSLITFHLATPCSLNHSTTRYAPGHTRRLFTPALFRIEMISPNRSIYYLSFNASNHCSCHL